MSDAAAAVSVRGIGKRFGERTALRDVAFDVSPGELVAIVGPNGAGKTTLLSIIAGVQSASEGEVLVSVSNTSAISGAGTGADTDTDAVPDAGAGKGTGRGTAIGWAPQQAAVYSKLSVAENLRLFARLQKLADPEGEVERMLAQTGLGERADERVERLSGGNRQRVNVALGLIGRPLALALDEPTSALDPGQRERLWEFVAALAEGGTAVLFSTHHLGEVRRYATRAIVLADGELLFDGAPAELVRANGQRGPGGEQGEQGEQDFERAFVQFLRERGH